MSIASGVSEIPHCYYCEVNIYGNYIEQRTCGIRGTYCSILCAHLEHETIIKKILQIMKERKLEEAEEFKEKNNIKATIQKNKEK